MSRIAGIAAIALVACAQTQHSRSDLEDANDSFSKAIRWSDLSSLSTRVVPERQAEFAKLATGSDLKVTEYEMQDVAVRGHSFVSTLPDLGMLAVFAVLLAGLALRLFRWQTTV